MELGGGLRRHQVMTGDKSRRGKRKRDDEGRGGARAYWHAAAAAGW